MRHFARLDSSEVEQVDLHKGLESTLALVNHKLKGRIQVVREFGDIPAVECHGSQINQVFMNLLVNAIQAIEGKGRITIRSWVEGPQVRVAFQDTGQGIAEADLPKVFDPGFTTKGVGVGTGLGLSIVHQIVEEHRGQIEVQSELGQGTCVTLSLPLRHGRH